MRVEIKVKTRAGKSEIYLENGTYKAYLRSAPEKGKANLELITLASKFFGKPATIKSGFTSKNKILEIGTAPARISKKKNFPS